MDEERYISTDSPELFLDTKTNEYILRSDIPSEPDPRRDVMKGILDPGVLKRSSLLPLVRTKEGVRLGLPGFFAGSGESDKNSMLQSLMFPGALAKGYRSSDPIHEAAVFGQNIGGAGSTLSSLLQKGGGPNTTTLGTFIGAQGLETLLTPAKIKGPPERIYEHVDYKDVPYYQWMLKTGVIKEIPEGGQVYFRGFREAPGDGLKTDPEELARIEDTAARLRTFFELDADLNKRLAGEPNPDIRFQMKQAAAEDFYNRTKGPDPGPFVSELAEAPFKSGFFRGEEGKLRFELDTSSVRLKPGAIGSFPGPKTKKFEDGTIVSPSSYDKLTKIAGRKVHQATLLKDEGFVDGFGRPLRIERGEYIPQKLGDLVDFPELFKAYPDLKNINVMHITPSEAAKQRLGGYYSHSRNLIKAVPGTEESLKRILLHEIQHGIQRREGFLSGGSARALREDLNMTQEGLINAVFTPEEIALALGKNTGKKATPKNFPLSGAHKSQKEWLADAAATQLYLHLPGEKEARLAEWRMKTSGMLRNPQSSKSPFASAAEEAAQEVFHTGVPKEYGRSTFPQRSYFPIAPSIYAPGSGQGRVLPNLKKALDPEKSKPGHPVLKRTGEFEDARLLEGRLAGIVRQRLKEKAARKKHGGFVEKPLYNDKRYR